MCSLVVVVVVVVNTAIIRSAAVAAYRKYFRCVCLYGVRVLVRECVKKNMLVKPSLVVPLFGAITTLMFKLSLFWVPSWSASVVQKLMAFAFTYTTLTALLQFRIEVANGLGSSTVIMSSVQQQQQDQQQQPQIIKWVLFAYLVTTAYIILLVFIYVSVCQWDYV